MSICILDTRPYRSILVKRSSWSDTAATFRSCASLRSTARRFRAKETIFGSNSPATWPADIWEGPAWTAWQEALDVGRWKEWSQPLPGSILVFQKKHGRVFAKAKASRLELAIVLFAFSLATRRYLEVRFQCRIIGLFVVSQGLKMNGSSISKECGSLRYLSAFSQLFVSQQESIYRSHWRKSVVPTAIISYQLGSWPNTGPLLEGLRSLVSDIV